jgi:VWFA-related protein
MRMRRRQIVAGVTAAAFLPLALHPARAQDPQGTFRAGVAVVEVPVAVRDGRRPLGDLDAGSFVLTDNGVRQQIEAASMAARPLDVSLLVDMAVESLNQYFHSFDSFRSDAGAIARLLGRDDRLQVTTFAAAVTNARPMTPMTRDDGELPLENPTAGVRGQDLTDTLLYAFAWPRQVGRSHLIVLFWNSDSPAGELAASTLPLDQLDGVARHSDAVLYAVLSPPFRLPGEPLPERVFSIEALARKTVAATAAMTGGRALTAGNATGALRDIVKEFRSGYLLRYTVHGVPKGGWHEIAVTVPSCPKCTIQARKGYFGD